MTRILEPNLILPTVYLIARHPDISTSGLIRELTELFHPAGEDAAILSGRNDSKFSQIVRNITAHHTLEGSRLGYATYERRRNNGHYRITPLGEQYLESSLPSIEYLFGNHFQISDIVDGLSTIVAANQQHRRLRSPVDIDENTPIFEGTRRRVTTVVSDRSTALRNAATAQYSRPDGHVLCKVCDFDFWSIYGEAGRGFIEIHHKTPLFQYEDQDTTLFLQEAVARVAPVCSNCHRMLHRNRGQVMDVDALRALILARRNHPEPPSGT